MSAPSCTTGTRWCMKITICLRSCAIFRCRLLEVHTSGVSCAAGACKTLVTFFSIQTVWFTQLHSVEKSCRCRCMPQAQQRRSPPRIFTSPTNECACCLLLQNTSHICNSGPVLQLLARISLATTSGQSAVRKEIGLLWVQAQAAGEVQRRLNHTLGHCPGSDVNS